MLADVDRAKAKWWAGRYAVALELAASAFDASEALGHAPTRCAAMLATGIAQEKARKLAESRTTLRDAVLCAAEIDDAGMEAWRGAGSCICWGRELREPEAALALRLPVQAALHRAGGTTSLRGDTALYLAVALSELAVTTRRRRRPRMPSNC